MKGENLYYIGFVDGYDVDSKRYRINYGGRQTEWRWVHDKLVKQCTFAQRIEENVKIARGVAKKCPYASCCPWDPLPFQTLFDYMDVFTKTEHKDVSILWRKERWTESDEDEEIRNTKSNLKKRRRRKSVESEDDARRGHHRMRKRRKKHKRRKQRRKRKQSDEDTADEDNVEECKSAPWEASMSHLQQQLQGVSAGWTESLAELQRRLPLFVSQCVQRSIHGEYDKLEEEIRNTLGTQVEKMKDLRRNLQNTIVQPLLQKEVSNQMQRDLECRKLLLGEVRKSLYEFNIKRAMAMNKEEKHMHETLSKYVSDAKALLDEYVESRMLEKPKERMKAKKPKTCFICKETGHFAKKCPKKKKERPVIVKWADGKEQTLKIHD